MWHLSDSGCYSHNSELRACFTKLEGGMRAVGGGHNLEALYRGALESNIELGLCGSR